MQQNMANFVSHTPSYPLPPLSLSLSLCPPCWQFCLACRPPKSRPHLLSARCNRFSQGGVALDWDQVVGDLGEIRVAFSGCTQTDSENCSKNLLRFYRQWHQAGKMERWPQASEFIRCVFCCPITTVKVESMFSIMNYNKSGSRCRMADDTVCAVVQLKDLTNPLADPNCKKGYGARAALNETKALEHDLPPTFRRGGASSAL
jgi:hypothetical protein